MSNTPWRRVYLDTSVVSALFDDRTPERQQLTCSIWNDLTNYEICISEKVLDEIAIAPTQVREKMLATVSDFEVLPVNEEARKLARVYIEHGIFTEKYLDDALHVALASVHGVSYLLSWNYRHLVKVKTRNLVALVNTLHDYLPIEIITPPEL